MRMVLVAILVFLGVLELGHQQEATGFVNYSPTAVTTRAHHSAPAAVYNMAPGGGGIITTASSPAQQTAGFLGSDSDCSNNPKTKIRNNVNESRKEESRCSSVDYAKCQEDEEQDQQQEPQDTILIRVRIWQALANGQEYSLSQLSLQLSGGITKSELRHHLSHVKKQAKTFGNKSREWRTRRGVESDGNDDNQPSSSLKKQIRLEERQGQVGKRREIFVRLRRG
jgi:hypothetical protein